MSNDQSLSVSDKKRKQIIEAAIAEFQERGFSGASMDRISDRACVSKRTVYSHFDNKEALFREIGGGLLSRMTAALDLRFEPGVPIRDQLTRLGWAEGSLLTDPLFMRTSRMFLGEMIRDPVLAEELACKVDKTAVFTTFMRDAFQAGALSNGDPDVVGSQFLALIKARGFMPYLASGGAPEQGEMENIINEAVDLVLRAFAPQSRRPGD